MASVAGLREGVSIRRKVDGFLTRISTMSTVTILVMLLLAGGAIRMLLTLTSSGHAFDQATMQAWTRALIEYPLSEFYALDLSAPQDHLPGDLIILAALGQMVSAIAPGGGDRIIPDTNVFKAVAIVADLLIGILIHRIGLRVTSQRAAIVAASVWLFNPAVIFISSVWGQWDAVSALLMTISMLLVFREGRWISVSWVTLAYACLIKPQLALVAPFVLVYAWRQDRSGGLVNSATGIGLGALLVQAIGGLFLVGLPGIPMRWSLIDRLRSSVEEYDSVALGAGNLWLLLIGRDEPFSDQAVVMFGLSAQMIGAMLFGIGMCVALLVAWRHPAPAVGLLSGSSIALMTMYMVMTRMHERYLFPAIPLAILAAMTLPALRKSVALITLTFTINLYLAYTNGGGTYLIPALQSDWFYRLNTAIQLAAWLWFIWNAHAATRQRLTIGDQYGDSERPVRVTEP